MNKEKIKELEEEISEAKRKIDELTAKLEEERNFVDITDRWKPACGQLYYNTMVYSYDGVFWCDDEEDSGTYDSFDIWKTSDRAKEVYEKIKILRMMEQIHDILCPEYKPNWNSSLETKWHCYYDFNLEKWCVGRSVYYIDNWTYFDTEEHAEQARKILNGMGIIPA